MTKNLKRHYELLMDDLSEDTDDKYVQFLKEKPRTFVYENLIFDLENLDGYYNCAGCKRKKPGAFCCSGYDLELTGHDIEKLEKIMPELANKYPGLKRSLKGENFWRYGDEFEKHMRRKGNDDCIFLMPGGDACYIHAWALERGIDPLDLKPYVCSLYPVVVVIIDDEVVISTMNEESRVILDAGENTVPCTVARGGREDHILVRSREILVRMFGPKIYRELAKRVFGK
jgi:hypothetical protein